jgi:hypothetical protein
MMIAIAEEILLIPHNAFLCRLTPIDADPQLDSTGHSNEIDWRDMSNICVILWMRSMVTGTPQQRFEATAKPFRDTKQYTL